MFCALLNVFIILFFTRVRVGHILDLVSKWGVCFGVRELRCLAMYMFCSQEVPGEKSDNCVGGDGCDSELGETRHMSADARSEMEEGVTTDDEDDDRDLERDSEDDIDVEREFPLNQ